MEETLIKKIINWILIISIVMMLLLGTLLYFSYRKTQGTNTTLLEINTALYQNPLQLKKGRVDDLSVNLIFYTSSKDEDYLEVAIEILDCKKELLSYVEIPSDTQISISKELYQKLAAAYPTLPQFFQLQQLRSLFDKKKRFSYAQLIIDEKFAIDSSYYTWIESNEDTFEAYIKNLHQQYDESYNAKHIIHDVYETIESNLTEDDKLMYSQYYDSIKTDDITFYEVQGLQHTDSFEADEIKFKELMNQLMNGKTGIE